MADGWDGFWRQLHALRTAVAASKAINVNSLVLREQAQSLVQAYFREARPEFIGLGGEEEAVASLDEETQQLLELSNGKNAKKSYDRVLRSMSRQKTPTSTIRERLVGASRATAAGSHAETESQILRTLVAMLPDAASSYEQALIDLREGRACSWRGTSVELREVVREVLDHLAPDDSVMKEPGFQAREGPQGADNEAEGIIRVPLTSTLGLETEDTPRRDWNR